MAEIKKLGVQLFTVRDYMGGEEQIRETFSKLKAIGYDEVQTAGCQVPYDVFGQLAKDAGLEIVGTHDDLGLMLNDTDKAIERHELLNTKLMGIGGWGFNNAEEIDTFCNNINNLGKKIADKGYKFSYHNHSSEFVKVEENRTILEHLSDCLDPGFGTFCLDTYWVQHGGGDVRFWINKLANRIEVLHLKDMKMTPNGQAMTEIGNGNLNWQGIIEEANKSDVKHYVVEHDVFWKDDDPFKSLEISANYLRKNFMK